MEKGYRKIAKTLLKIKVGGFTLLDTKINYKGVIIKTGSISTGIAK